MNSLIPSKLKRKGGIPMKDKKKKHKSKKELNDMKGKVRYPKNRQ